MTFNSKEVTLNRDKSFTIAGVTIYPMTDEALSKAMHNPNSIVVLASLDDIFTPIYYQRYADYLSPAALSNIGLIECLTPYVIDTIKYPISSNFNYLYNLFSREDITS